MVNAGRHQPGLEQSQQRQEQRTPSPLSLLPIDLLGQVLPAPSVKGARRDPNRLSVRAACRWLRDAFDSCNTHLVLVGAAEAGFKDSAQRQSFLVLLQRLIARTSSLHSLHIKDWDNSRELLKLPVPWGQLRVLDLSGWPCRNWYSASATLELKTRGLLAQCCALDELVIFGFCLYVSEPESLPFCSTLRSLRLLEPSSSDHCPAIYRPVAAGA